MQPRDLQQATSNEILVGWTPVPRTRHQRQFAPVVHAPPGHPDRIMWAVALSEMPHPECAKHLTRFGQHDGHVASDGPREGVSNRARIASDRSRAYTSNRMHVGSDGWREYFQSHACRRWSILTCMHVACNCWHLCLRTHACIRRAVAGRVYRNRHNDNACSEGHAFVGTLPERSDLGRNTSCRITPTVDTYQGTPTVGETCFAGALRLHVETYQSTPTAETYQSTQTSSAACARIFPEKEGKARDCTCPFRHQATQKHGHERVMAPKGQSACSFSNGDGKGGGMCARTRDGPRICPRLPWVWPHGCVNVAAYLHFIAIAALNTKPMTHVSIRKLFVCAGTLIIKFGGACGSNEHIPPPLSYVLVHVDIHCMRQ